MEEMRLADERLNVLEHPLIAHKISIMRDASTAPSQFRQLVHEVAMLEVYEASRDLPTEPVEVDTPLQRTVGKRIAGEKLAVVPILRAGMGMLDGVLSAIPSAAVGVLGMERDEQTHQPREWEMISSAFASILSAIAPASTLNVPFSIALRTAFTRPASKSVWLRPVCSISRAVRESVSVPS